jgi:hypothetical protein
MSMLRGHEIKLCVADGSVVIEPFVSEHVVSYSQETLSCEKSP